MTNPYEEACERFQEARRAWAQAKEALREAQIRVYDAEEECNAEEQNLARYEVKPGIPLPEYDKLRADYTGTES